MFNKLNLIFIVIALFTMEITYSQNVNKFLLKSFKYINYKTKSNFHLMNTYIVIYYNGRYYVLSEYYKDDKTITRAKIFYELEKIDDKKFWFKITCCGSIIDGTFLYKSKKDKFYNLHYVEMHKDVFKPISK